jgi:hypothetical protein
MVAVGNQLTRFYRKGREGRKGKEKILAANTRENTRINQMKEQNF